MAEQKRKQKRNKPSITGFTMTDLISIQVAEALKKAVK